jgi:hypothetical protein
MNPMIVFPMIGAAVCFFIAVHRTLYDPLPILVMLSLIGCVACVSVASFFALCKE